MSDLGDPTSYLRAVRGRPRASARTGTRSARSSTCSPTPTPTSSTASSSTRASARAGTASRTPRRSTGCTSAASLLTLGTDGGRAPARAVREPRGPRGRRGRRGAGGPGRQAQARLGPDLRQALIRGPCGSCSPTTTASRPRASRPCGARCWRSRTSSSRSSRPTPTARRSARGITTRRPLWVRGGRLRRRHGRLRHRRHAGRLRALRRARAGRGLPGRADRLRHQPRLQPRRRHLLLGHRRRRDRGHRARAPGDRRLAAVARARDGLPARPPLRVRRRGRVHRARGRGDRRRPAARRHAAQPQLPRGRDRGRRGRPARQAHLPRRARRSRTSSPAARQYRIYGDAPDYERQEGTDLAAVADGRVAVTPIHFDLTDEPGIETLQAYDLARLLEPAAEELQ